MTTVFGSPTVDERQTFKGLISPGGRNSEERNQPRPSVVHMMSTLFGLRWTSQNKGKHFDKKARTRGGDAGGDGENLSPTLPPGMISRFSFTVVLLWLCASLPSLAAGTGNNSSASASHQIPSVESLQSHFFPTATFFNLDQIHSAVGPSLHKGPPLDITLTKATSTPDAQSSNDAAIGTSASSSGLLKPALFIGGGLALTGILIRTDEQTYLDMRDWREDNVAIRDVSPVITNLGDGRATLAIFGGLLGYSYFSNDRTALRAGKIGLESFLLSGIAVQLLKHTFGRERPSTATVSGGRWNGAYFLLNHGSGKRGGYARYDAFPSGHTATVFAAATALSEVYQGSPWVSYTSYSIASAVAISRVMEQAHWASDCFVGGLIGYFSAKLVVRWNHSDKPVAFAPVIGRDRTGFALNVGF